MLKLSALPASFAFAALIAVACAGPAATPASAVVCANGVYHAGCAGPHGAVGVNKYPYYGHPYYHPYPRPYYGYPHCARGYYWRNGARYCY